MNKIVLTLLLLWTASINAVSIDNNIKMAVGFPQNNANVSGVGTINGFATSPTDIEFIQVQIDEQVIANIPTADTRNDIFNLYPTYPNSLYSGFSVRYNFSNLSEGQHVVDVFAINPTGDYNISSSTINVTKYKDGWASANQINLSNTSLESSGNSATIRNVNFKGVNHDIILKWDQTIQNLAVVEVEEANQSPPSAVTPSFAGAWEGRAVRQVTSAGGDPCSSADIFMHVIKVNDVNYIDSVNLYYDLGGGATSSSTYAISSDGFVNFRLYNEFGWGDVTGTFKTNGTASGNWVDSFGCYGTWSVSR